MENRLICICGPTASGKTALSVALAEQLHTEIISADSMQIYRGMDIGTAKPTTGERKGVPHHMLDICAPDEPFSVARYVELADAAAQDILARGRIPIVAGGTGLYMDALTKPIFPCGKNIRGWRGSRGTRRYMPACPQLIRKARASFIPITSSA